MANTPDALKARKQDYFLASWQNEQLEMDPRCQCGEPLDEEYYCTACERQCECTFILCSDHPTYLVVQKFIHGNPDFKNFEADLQV